MQTKTYAKVTTHDIVFTINCKIKEWHVYKKTTQSEKPFPVRLVPCLRVTHGIEIAGRVLSWVTRNQQHRNLYFVTVFDVERRLKYYLPSFQSKMSRKKSKKT